MHLLAEPRDLAELTEIDPTLPEGEGEHFSGYGVMGLPFASGHLLALRRFPASSIGPGFTAVWHRTPAGRWTFWTDVHPGAACGRFFGSAIDEAGVAPIRLHWTGPRALTVQVGKGMLEWKLELAPTPATLLLNGVSALLPAAAWRSQRILRVLGRVAGPLLGAGDLVMTGEVPNGQRFQARPRLVWVVRSAEARLAGMALGRPAPLPLPVSLGDFVLPQRGLFVIGGATFERFDPGQHSRALLRPSLESAARLAVTLGVR